jgi:hypothetical protein
MGPDQAKAHFEAFGFVVFRGALADDLDWLLPEFEAVFRDHGVQHDGSTRSAIVPFIDHRPRLRELVDHPFVADVFARLIAPDWNFSGSDGNYYTGDTRWHSDGTHRLVRFVKLAVYLDPLTADTGALRLIPGTHRLDDTYAQAARQAAESETLWGVGGAGVPAVAVSTQPGDVVAFDQNLMHSAWGGGARRRMFTLNACSTATTPEASAELRGLLEHHASFWIDSMFDPAMVETAPPARRRRLEHVLAHQGDLARLAAEARARMERPAWQTPARIDRTGG